MRVLGPDPGTVAILVGLLLLLAAATPPSAPAQEVTQEDIDALERDLARARGDRRDPLLTMLLEGLVARCYPEDADEANPVVRDEFSRRCLSRAVEVAREITTIEGHDHRDRALFVAGRASIALNRPAEGADLLRQFLEEFPDGEEAPLAHVALAELARDAGDLEGAAGHYRAAAVAVDGAAGAHLRYRLAWCLRDAGRPGEGAEALADLLAMSEGPEDAARQVATEDLAVFLAEAADADLTLRLAGGIGDDGAAPYLVERVAGALMAGGRTAAAARLSAAMVERWGDRLEAPSWRVARIDAPAAVDDDAAVAAAVRALMERFGPGSPHARSHGAEEGYRAQALRTEEAARSTIGRLHAERDRAGSLSDEEIEELYRAYLEAFPDAGRRAEMRLALAALLESAGRVPDALDEMLVVVGDEAGRERGVQAASLAMDLIAGHLPDQRAPGPLTDVEQRLVRLAEIFADGYRRHPDGARYLAAAGQVLADRGRHDRAREMLVSVTERFPSSPEARPAAALAAETTLATGDWSATAALVDQLLANDRLAAAHPDLAAVLARTRSTARFKHAEEVAADGDPAGAAALFEQVAAEDPDGELAAAALLNAAISRDEAGDGSRAAMLFRRVYSDHPDHALAPTALEQDAYLRWEREDYAGAARLYRRLADDYPASDRAAWALYTSAALDDQEGRFDEAIEGYSSLLERFPTAPECADAEARLRELTAGE